MGIGWQFSTQFWHGHKSTSMSATGHVHNDYITHGLNEIAEVVLMAYTSEIPSRLPGGKVQSYSMSVCHKPAQVWLRLYQSCRLGDYKTYPVKVLQ